MKFYGKDANKSIQQIVVKSGNIIGGDILQDHVAEALIDILISKGIITEEEFNDKISSIHNKKKMLTENRNISDEYKIYIPQNISSLKEAEKEIILKTLYDLQGNRSEAARRLQITRKTLQNKLKSYTESDQ